MKKSEKVIYEINMHLTSLGMKRFLILFFKQYNVFWGILE